MAISEKSKILKSFYWSFGCIHSIFFMVLNMSVPSIFDSEVYLFLFAYKYPISCERLQVLDYEFGLSHPYFLNPTFLIFYFMKKDKNV